METRQIQQARKRSVHIKYKHFQRLFCILLLNLSHSKGEACIADRFSSTNDRSKKYLIHSIDKSCH